MNRRKIFLLILSFIYSCFIIVGTSFMISNSFRFIYECLLLNVICFIICFKVFYLILNKLFFICESKKDIKIKLNKKSRIYVLFNKHPLLFCMFFMLICWLPYIISFYPGILSPDPSFQIRQYFGIPNKYLNYSILLDPNVTITNHHPVIHTLLIGTCVKIGQLIGNVNFGIFIYSFLQIMLLSFTLASTINFLRKHNIKDNFLLIMLLVYSLVPVFPMYSMTIVKDVIFTCFIIFYIMYLYDLSKKDNITFKECVILLFLLILIILFRNNGIHTIVLSFPLLFLLRKKKKYIIKLLMIFVCIITCYFTYSKVLLPYFRITPSSVRESLSIPFQQTARFVKEHSEDVTSEERDIIDKILEYDSLKERYDYDLSDPVKNKYNKYATTDDLKEYFKVWAKQFLKHPVTYVESTISNTYGYFYPLKNGKFLYYRFDDRIVKNGFDYHYNDLSLMRKTFIGFGLLFKYIPITNIAFNVWALIFFGFYYLYKRKYSSLVYLSPSYILLLVCIASPANGYFRYAMPFVFALMLNLGLFIKENN